MNFLAHLYLADDTPASRIGNVMPDLVRGRIPDPLTPQVKAGIVTHRRVDAFTDTHAVFARSRARLRERHGIFSGILVDVFYDHVLARTWRRYHPEMLDLFIADVYRDMTEHTELMPPAMRPIIERMAGQDWLSTYATPEGIELTLSRMSRRFSERFERDVPLARAADDLRIHYGAFSADFHEFFPQLIRFLGRTPDTHPTAKEAGVV